jgi:hypothetical protein
MSESGHKQTPHHLDYVRFAPQSGHMGGVSSTTCAQWRVASLAGPHW